MDVVDKVYLYALYIYILFYSSIYILYSSYLLNRVLPITPIMNKEHQTLRPIILPIITHYAPLHYALLYVKVIKLSLQHITFKQVPHYNMFYQTKNKLISFIYNMILDNLNINPYILIMDAQPTTTGAYSILSDETKSLYYEYTQDEEAIIDDLQIYDSIYDWIQYKQEGGLLHVDAFLMIQNL